MGTHPIFESDFDCLTDMSENTDEIIKKLHFFKFGEHYRLLDEIENSDSTQSSERHSSSDTLNILSEKFPDIKFEEFANDQPEISPIDFELQKLNEMRAELREQRERDKKDLHDELRLRDSQIENLQLQLKNYKSTRSMSRNRFKPIRRKIGGSMVTCCGKTE